MEGCTCVGCAKDLPEGGLEYRPPILSDGQVVVHGRLRTLRRAPVIGAWPKAGTYCPACWGKVSRPLLVAYKAGVRVAAAAEREEEKAERARAAAKAKAATAAYRARMAAEHEARKARKQEARAAKAKARVEAKAAREAKAAARAKAKEAKAATREARALQRQLKGAPKEARPADPADLFRSPAERDEHDTQVAAARLLLSLFGGES